MARMLTSPPVCGASSQRRRFSPTTIRISTTSSFRWASSSLLRRWTQAPHIRSFQVIKFPPRCSIPPQRSLCSMFPSPTVFVYRVAKAVNIGFRKGTGQKPGFVLKCHLFLNLKSLNSIARIKELMRRLRQRQEQLDQALREKQRWEDENARLREENARLQQELETAQRAAKRQAAPFSRGKRKTRPKSPGRKSGKQY